jgi:hypothetical protein
MFYRATQTRIHNTSCSFRSSVTAEKRRRAVAATFRLFGTAKQLVQELILSFTG